MSQDDAVVLFTSETNGEYMQLDDQKGSAGVRQTIQLYNPAL
jgi:hypothetical protein